MPTEAELIPRRRWTRVDWIDFSLRALERGGIAAVRIEDMARRSGRTPGSFYSHFANREQLHAAMIETWLERRLVQIDWFHDHLRRQGRYSLSGILQDFAERTTGAWGVQARSDLELAMRIWARSQPQARRALACVDALRVNHARAMVQAEHALDDRQATEIGVLLNWLLAGRHIVFLGDLDGGGSAAGLRTAALLSRLAQLAEAAPEPRSRPPPR